MRTPMTGVPPLVFESFGYRNCWEPFPEASLVPNFFILNLLGFPKGRTPGHLHDERATGHPKKKKAFFFPHWFPVEWYCTWKDKTKHNKDCQDCLNCNWNSFQGRFLICQDLVFHSSPAFAHDGIMSPRICQFSTLPGGAKFPKFRIRCLGWLVGHKLKMFGGYFFSIFFRCTGHTCSILCELLCIIIYVFTTILHTIHIASMFDILFTYCSGHKNCRTGVSAAYCRLQNEGTRLKFMNTINDHARVDQAIRRPSLQTRCYSHSLKPLVLKWHSS